MTDGRRAKRGQAGLTPAVFHILLALADGNRHGYAVMKEVERRSDGEVQLRPGTMYRAITRLLEDGWIEATAEAPDPLDDDARRKYYQLTQLGRTKAREEATRLVALVRAARSKKLVEEADLV